MHVVFLILLSDIDYFVVIANSLILKGKKLLFDVNVAIIVTYLLYFILNISIYLVFLLIHVFFRSKHQMYFLKFVFKRKHGGSCCKSW
jgi:hypothetical protein